MFLFILFYLNAVSLRCERPPVRPTAASARAVQAFIVEIFLPAKPPPASKSRKDAFFFLNDFIFLLRERSAAPIGRYRCSFPPSSSSSFLIPSKPRRHTAACLPPPAFLWVCVCSSPTQQQLSNPPVAAWNAGPPLLASSLRCRPLTDASGAVTQERSDVDRVGMFSSQWENEQSIYSPTIPTYSLLGDLWSC